MGVPARFVGAPLRVLQNARWSEPLLEHILRDSSKGGKGLRCDLEGAGQVAKYPLASCPRLQVPGFRAWLNALHRRVETEKAVHSGVLATGSNLHDLGGGGRIRGQDYEERRPVPVRH
jgi:hypothetical protein